jgi:hypothetical protein
VEQGFNERGKGQASLGHLTTLANMEHLTTLVRLAIADADEQTNWLSA